MAQRKIKKHLKWQRRLLTTGSLVPKPCPCCGNKFIYTGHLSGMILGVECVPWTNGCGLSIGRSMILTDIPKNLVRPKGKELEVVFNYLTDLAIKAWNCRQ